MPVPQNSASQTLHPGDVALAFEGERLETLLGSCVAVILTDPRRTVGVMCHIVYCGLPNAASKGDTAYAVFAMQEMFTRLRTIGITPQLCQAFIFGGGNMFPGMFSRKHVGTSNVEWVEHFLWTQGIEIVGESTGGSCYRKISWTVGAQALNVECVDSNDEDE